MDIGINYLKEELMKSPIVLLQALFTDVKRLEPAVTGLDRDLLTIEKRFKHEGYSFLTVTLPTLDAAILNGFALGRFASPPGFKLAKGTVLPRLFSGLLRDVFDPSSGFLKPDANPGVVKCLREILLWFKKLKLEPKRNDELRKEAEFKFFSNDNYCEQHEVDSQVRTSLESVARLVLRNLCATDFEAVSYKHGPGAVYEGVKGNQKWNLLFDHISSDAVDISEVGMDQFFYSAHGLINPDQLELFPLSDICRLHGSLAGDSARLVCVPKNSTSVRTITVEPLWKQYVQQGLNTVLRDNIKKCDILSQSLSLTDQSKNQKLALEGSLTGLWSTLDLKSASDLLSRKLVKIIFGHQEEFYRRMELSRSCYVDSPNGRVYMHKYAGMGNATTFPVQSVTFAVIAYAAILNERCERITLRNLKRIASFVRVFGDDIIVKSEHTRQVVAWLERAGLKVNADKSFSTGCFRESCGTDAFRGYDVTPLYLRYSPDDSSVQPSHIAHLVSLSNLCWLRGLYSTSELLKNEVEMRLRRRLPIIHSSSSGLGWVSRTEAFTPTRWNKDLHRFETKTYALVPYTSKDGLDGYPALLKFFHSPSEEDSGWDPTASLVRQKDHLSSSPVRFRHRMVQRWVAS